VLRDLDSNDEVVRATERLLRLAEVRDQLPTPVEDLIEAAKLARGDDDLFDDRTIDDAPAYLRSAMRAVRHKIHAVLDRKRRLVYVDPSIAHGGRRTFRALHEVGHAILPSQNADAHVDDSSTLSWLTNVKWERDANQASSELIFQRERFTRMAAEYEIGLAAVTELAGYFGASIQAAVRRFTEFHDHPVAAVALDVSPCRREPEAYRRYEAICSPAWERTFERPDMWQRTLDATVYPWAADARLAAVAMREWDGQWPDRDNTMVPMRAQIMSNRHRLLVLLWRPRHEFLRRRRTLVIPDAA
jgi:Zn-dependent peptidase ImmA (M78 family)